MSNELTLLEVCARYALSAYARVFIELCLNNRTPFLRIFYTRTIVTWGSILSNELSAKRNPIEFNFIGIFRNIHAVPDWPCLQLSSNMALELPVKEDKGEWHDDKVKQRNNGFGNVH